MAWREALLTTIGPGAFSGITLGDWLRVLRQNLVKLLELTDRVLFQRLETHLVKMTWRNQPALLEEYLEDLLVLPDDAVVQLGFVRPLQAPPWPGFSHHVPG
jgi:hypothetical protein